MVTHLGGRDGHTACDLNVKPSQIVIGPEGLTCEGCLDILKNFYKWFKTHKYVGGKKCPK